MKPSFMLRLVIAAQVIVQRYVYVCVSASDFYAACPVVTEITCGFLKYVVSLILLGVGLSQSNTGSAVR